VPSGPSRGHRRTGPRAGHRCQARRAVRGDRDGGGRRRSVRRGSRGGGGACCGGRIKRPGGGRWIATISRAFRGRRCEGGRRRVECPRGPRPERLPPRGRCAAGGSGGRASQLPPRPGRPTATVIQSSPEIRRLTYADLPQVIAIERRAFPTPWSLAMFVLELSKPSGICLAALRNGRIVGYLVCSRYDTVWHLMNVAVDERLRREGIATALLEHLFE